MANSDARRMANAACCTADGGSTPLLSLFLSLALSLCLSPPSFVLSLSILCLLCCFCCCFSRCFSCCFLVLWLPTRRHVWLPLDFRHDFLSRTSLLPPSLPPCLPLLPFPYAISVLPFIFLLPSLLAFFVLVGQKSTHELWHF